MKNLTILLQIRIREKVENCDQDWGGKHFLLQKYNTKDNNKNVNSQPKILTTIKRIEISLRSIEHHYKKNNFYLKQFWFFFLLCTYSPLKMTRKLRQSLDFAYSLHLKIQVRRRWFILGKRRCINLTDIECPYILLYVIIDVIYSGFLSVAIMRHKAESMGNLMSVELTIQS